MLDLALATLRRRALLVVIVAGAALVAGDAAAAAPRPELQCFYYREFPVEGRAVPSANGYINFGISMYLKPGARRQEGAELVDIADDRPPPASFFGPGISWTRESRRGRAEGGRLGWDYFVSAVRQPGDTTPSAARGRWAFTARYVSRRETCDAEPGGEAAHVLAELAPLNRAIGSFVDGGGGPQAEADALRYRFATVLERFPAIWGGAPSGTLLRELARADTRLAELDAQLDGGRFGSADDLLRQVSAAYSEAADAAGRGNAPAAVRAELSALAADARSLRGEIARMTPRAAQTALGRLAARASALVMRRFPRILGSSFNSYLLRVEGWQANVPSGLGVYRRADLVERFRSTGRVLRALEAQVRRA